MRACIFDLDGTLLDSMDVWGKIDVDFLQKRGFAVPSDYMDSISSMSFTECAVYTIGRFNLPDSVDGLMREWTDMAAYAYGHTVLMKPFAKEYLSVLRERGLKLAVATSLAAELYEPALRGQGIYDWFQAICNSEEVGCGKSQPDIFLLAAQKLGVLPGDCMVFEDILPAVKSAKNAGMKVCGVYDKAAANDWERIKETADYAIIDWKTALDLL
jgi:beta-phosphoglucomutase-like phosphatase (HAD superfamily)